MKGKINYYKTISALWCLFLFTFPDVSKTIHFFEDHHNEKLCNDQGPLAAKHFHKTNGHDLHSCPICLFSYSPCVGLNRGIINIPSESLCDKRYYFNQTNFYSVTNEYCSLRGPPSYS